MSYSRPTILDVANRSGFSKSLVSLALAGSPRVSATSRERILEAANELGYRANAAARSLAARRSNTLGVLVLDLHNPVFAEILDGVQNEIRSRGFSVMLVSGGDDPITEQAEIGKLLEFQIEGLILISHRLRQEALQRIAAEVPTVVITRDDYLVTGMDNVSNDDVAGAQLAVEHLVSLGHQRIVHLSGGDNPVANLRSKGFSAAMQSYNLAKFAEIVPGGLTEAKGYTSAKAALQFKPTALFAANDVAAIGAIAAIEEAGLRVPEDISVIGYDGIAMGGLRRVNLTTIAQPLAELGGRAANLLLERIEDPTTPPRRDLVTSKLVVRGTTQEVR